MGFFDFAGSFPLYEGDANKVHRLNKRHDFIVRPLRAEIAGASLLDLAAHDGRWSYAYAAAGAARVVGIEGRQELIDDFRLYPDDEARARVELRCDDIFEGMERAIRDGERYDVVACVGILYHVMDHMRLMNLVRQLGPRLVIVDSLFIEGRSPFIQMVRERTEHKLNATPLYPGQEVAVIGIPSDAAMEAMAEAIGYRTEWVDWSKVPPDQRAYLFDYFSRKRRRRRTCYLRPA